MRSLSLVAVTIGALLATGAAEADAQQPGQVGGPPSLKYPRKDFGRKTTDVIVIGAGQSHFGPLEIVAYRTVQCLVLETDEPRIASLSEGCAYPGQLRGAISNDSSSYGGSREGPFSEISGETSTETASVRVTVRHRKRRKVIAATLAKPDGTLLARLQQPTPFAYWAVAVPGCVGDRGTRYAAFDATGTLLGAVRGVGGFCKALR